MSHGQSGPGLPGGLGLEEGSHVVAVTRYAEEAAVLVEKCGELRGRQLLFGHDVQQDGGIEVAAPRPHHQALEGCEAHRGVDRFRAPYRGDGAAVAEVAGDHAQALVVGAAEKSRKAARHEAVGSPVEAIATDAVALVEHIGERVQERRLGHALVERRVEDGHVRSIGKELARGAISLDVGRVVKGGELEAFLDAPQHLIVDPNGGAEPLASVHHAVADRLDLPAVLEDRRFAPGQQIERPLHRDLVVENLGGLSMALATGHVHAQDGRTSDALDRAPGQDPVAIRDGRTQGVEKLELDRGASAVEDENLHPSILRCLRSRTLIDEEPTARLHPQVAGPDHLAQQRARPVLEVAELVEQVLHPPHHLVESHPIRQGQGPTGRP
jgi:hypothetical protein